jgi:hypothetical protein
MSHQPDNIFAGTQVVSLVEVRGTNKSLVHPRGAVGVVNDESDTDPVRVEAHREKLHSFKRGELPWSEMDAWRKDLHRDFEHALAETKLPERPDYEAANGFLIRARWKRAGSL